MALFHGALPLNRPWHRRDCSAVFDNHWTISSEIWHGVMKWCREKVYDVLGYGGCLCDGEFLRLSLSLITFFSVFHLVKTKQCRYLTSVMSVQAIFYRWRQMIIALQSRLCHGLFRRRAPWMQCNDAMTSDASSSRLQVVEMEWGPNQRLTSQ